MAAYSEILIEQHADFNTTITVDNTQGDDFDLSAYTVSSQIRKSYYSETFYTFDAAITDPSGGLISLSMTSANTALIDPGRYFYDVVIDGPVKIRVVEGIVTVMPGVTR